MAWQWECSRISPSRATIGTTNALLWHVREPLSGVVHVALSQCMAGPDVWIRDVHTIEGVDRARLQERRMERRGPRHLMATKHIIDTHSLIPGGDAESGMGVW